MAQDEPRRILHVDMDAFFASIEEQRRGIDGDPVVICVYSGRSADAGAVSTANYAARDLGIRAGMPISRAKSKAEDAEETVHFLPVEKPFYRQRSDEIREEVLEQHATTVEQASIDEAYLAVTDVTADFDDAVALAETVQEAIGDRFGLSCSIGVAPNKFVAKIASDQDKPGGVTVVRPGDVDTFLRGLELEELHGVGEETVAALDEIGIDSVAALAETEPARLVDRFGKQRGMKLWRHANGEDKTPVEEQEPSQFSRLTTLEENTADPDTIEAALDELADSLMERLDDAEVRFETVSFLAIDTDLRMHTRSTSLPSPVLDRSLLHEKATELMHAFLEDHDGLLRRVGVRASGFTSASDQSSLDAFTG